jgi:hypothetical protein
MLVYRQVHPTTGASERCNGHHHVYMTMGTAGCVRARGLLAANDVVMDQILFDGIAPRHPASLEQLTERALTLRRRLEAIPADRLESGLGGRPSGGHGRRRPRGYLHTTVTSGFGQIGVHPA